MENEIKVKLFPSHYNHDLGKSHKQFLSMSKSERLQIEEQLEIGVPRHRIVQNIRDEYYPIPEQDALPKHFASADTIYNIGRKIAHPKRKAPDDYTSAKNGLLTILKISFIQAFRMTETQIIR